MVESVKGWLSISGIPKGCWFSTTSMTRRLWHKCTTAWSASCNHLGYIPNFSPSPSLRTEKNQQPTHQSTNQHPSPTPNPPTPPLLHLAQTIHRNTHKVNRASTTTKPTLWLCRNERTNMLVIVLNYWCLLCEKIVLMVGEWRFGVVHQLIEEIGTRLKCNHPPKCNHPHHHTPVSLLPSSSPTTRPPRPPPDSDDSIHQPQRVKIYNPMSSSLENV